MNETESQLRLLIRESNLQPIRIHLDDGQAYTISHPDFAIVAEGALILARGPGTDLGDVSFTICYFSHIVRVEALNKKSKVGA